MPRITVSINARNEIDQSLLTLDLVPGTILNDIKDIIQTETAFATAAQNIFLNGRELKNGAQTIEEAGIMDGDMLAVLIRRHGEVVKEQKRQESSGICDGVDALRLGVDPEVERERHKQIDALNRDPFNREAQGRIEEIIRQDGVIENLQRAYEDNPSVFGRVNMLHINVEVNGHLVKAMVASCAQATIISPSCAETCGIARLIDKRYAGVARGVGTARILGRVHHAELKIGEVVMSCVFSVMEGDSSEVLLGLDMLKRYNMKIDLEKNALCFQGIEIPFLDESEIPRPVHRSTTNGPTTPVVYSTPGSGVQSTPTRHTSGATAGSPSTMPTSPPLPPPLRSRPEEFPREDIDQLLSLGFSKNAVIRALRAANGNIENAAGLLLSDMD